MTTGCVRRAGAPRRDGRKLGVPALADSGSRGAADRSLETNTNHRAKRAGGDHQLPPAYREHCAPEEVDRTSMLRDRGSSRLSAKSEQ